MRCQVATGVVHWRADEIFDVLAFGYHLSTIAPTFLSSESPRIDRVGIRFTTEWWEEIKRGIEASDNFILIMSPEALSSPVCHLEIEYAQELSKRIIPVYHVEHDRTACKEEFGKRLYQDDKDGFLLKLYGDRNPIKLFEDNWGRLPGLHRIDAQLRATETAVEDEAAFADFFPKLLEAIRINIDYLRAHTRYLTRALEWDRNGRRQDLLLFGSEIEAAKAWLVKAEEYAADAKANNEAAYPNEPTKPVQRDYIAASQRAQRRRRLVASSGVGGALLALAFAVGAAFVGGSATNSANVANTREAQANTTLTSVPPTLTLVNQQAADALALAATATYEQGAAEQGAATATRRVATAVALQAEAESQLATATQQVFEAQSTATQIPPTLTQAAVEGDILVLFAFVMLQQFDDPSEQIARLDELVAQYPDQALAYTARGVFHAAQGNLTETIADYTEAIRLNPQDAEAYNFRGITRAAQGDLQGAIADFDEAIHLDPQYADAYYNRGIARADLGDLESAITDYTEAIRLNPQHASAYRNRGLARADLGDLEGAIADYTEAISLNPQNATAYEDRGIARGHQGDLMGAIADFDEAIRLNPQSGDAYYNRATAWYLQGNYERAIADFTEAIRLNPQDAASYFIRGLAHRSRAESSPDRRADLAQALADWETAERLGYSLPQEIRDTMAEIEAELRGG
jgi:tetratricopeptide (TPR) repeat protein